MHQSRLTLSTQYYRPPFPEQRFWSADLAEIARTGFDSIYLTVPWSWVEAEPGVYRFDDLDRLVELAGGVGLKVILNLWTETQPVWVHRLHPDAAMIDHMGREVRSSQLAYLHFGLMPGCCTDHPAIRARAGDFMRAVAKHFASCAHLSTWDCWNEMRWMSQADGYVCFCTHTLARYRRWLEARYGTLADLNEAWRRRYVDWQDVIPAKSPARSYTDSLAWQQFISARTAEDLSWRRECVRSQDPARPIIAHAAFPSIYNTGEYFEYEPALGRGNDWELAQKVDGYGCSHFPAWFHPSPVDYGARLEAVRCATGEKPYWIAELQGGAAGHGMQAMPPVPADKQARWIWNGIARGAKAVNFWCWRDETFGRESGGFGIAGDDGHREARLASLARTAELFREHATLLSAYRPERARVAVVFEPRSYQLDWASFTTGGLAPAKEAPWPAGHSLQGYLRAFERLQIPYDVIEPAAIDSLHGYDLLVLPWPLVVNDTLATRLLTWVHEGGTLLTEASLDAFTETGLFKAPAERPLPRALGLEFSARRPLDCASLPFHVGDQHGVLHGARWREDIVAAGQRDAQPVVLRNVGSGHVVAVGSFVGLAYWEQRYADFERFIDTVAGLARVFAEFRCSIRDGETVQWRFGLAGDVPLLFVINEGAAEEVQFRIRHDRLREVRQVTDLVSPLRIETTAVRGELHLRWRLRAGGYHILRFQT